MNVTSKTGEGPMRAGILFADGCSAHFCAQAILAALLKREVKDEGHWVHTSLLESQIAMPDFQAAQCLIHHKLAQSGGIEHPLTVPTGVFETIDGDLNLAAIGQNMWKRVCVAPEMPQWMDEPGMGTDLGRVKNRAGVNEAVSAVFKKTAAEQLVTTLCSKPACSAGRSTASTKCLKTRRCKTCTVQLRPRKCVSHLSFDTDGFAIFLLTARKFNVWQNLSPHSAHPTASCWCHSAKTGNTASR